MFAMEPSEHLDTSGEECPILVIGGGVAGLSAAIYLARARHRTVVIDAGDSMAAWEPRVENYFGFPECISGEELIQRGRQQAVQFGAELHEDAIQQLEKRGDFFTATGQKKTWRAHLVLLATGICHIPPDIDGVRECLGHSMFFCKDCDGQRVKEKRIAIYGANDETARYALAMLAYSSDVCVVTNGHQPRWSERYEQWLRQHLIPVHVQPIRRVVRDNRQLRSLELEDRCAIELDALFTTRGDIYFNRLAKMVGAEIDPSGEIVVNQDLQTTVKGLYAAGCVTPANCQIGIAGGQGVIAAQAINCELFDQALASGNIRRFAKAQPESPGSLKNAAA